VFWWHWRSDSQRAESRHQERTIVTAPKSGDRRKSELAVATKRADLHEEAKISAELPSMVTAQTTKPDGKIVARCDIDPGSHVQANQQTGVGAVLAPIRAPHSRPVPGGRPSASKVK